ncbi:MAG: hypothetical protein JO367_16040, partial [Actinobacteria bacterium]|nr:hypothetical protein [Actinomycetota bacterium]
GAGPGGGPDVRVWSMDSNNAVAKVAEFFAYGSTFIGGVNVAVAHGAIITGAGPSGGPHVRQFSLVGTIGSGNAGFFAYDAGFRGGVHVTGGNATGDVVTGPGRGLGELRQFNAAGQELAALSPYGAGFTGGINVAFADISGQGQPEIVTAPQAGTVTVIGSRLQ